MKKLGIFSFFSGSGFLDLGFEKAGFEILFVNEIHKPFLDAYIHSRTKLNISPPCFQYSNESVDNFVYGHLSPVLSAYMKNAREKFDLLGFIGGPPCPDFSVGGKNHGKDGENGRLTKTYIDGIIKFKPDFFIFENVKGLLRTKKHREFYDDIKKQLIKNNYALTDRLINSIEYGVPQDRERIILFGVNKSLISDTNNTDLDGKFNWHEQMLHDKHHVLREISWPKKTPFQADSVISLPSHLKEYEKITIEHWFKKNDVLSHPNAKHYFTPRAALSKFQTIDEGDDTKKSFKRLHRWRYSPTAAYGNNEVHIHPYFCRRISAAEALAIQSLPKEFELPNEMSLTNMFKTIGNGVPYLLSLGLAKTTWNYLTKCTINSKLSEKHVEHQHYN